MFPHHWFDLMRQAQTMCGLLHVAAVRLSGDQTQKAMAALLPRTSPWGFPALSASRGFAHCALPQMMRLAYARYLMSSQRLPLRRISARRGRGPIPRQGSQAPRCGRGRRLDQLFARTMTRRSPSAADSDGRDCPRPAADPAALAAFWRQSPCIVMAAQQAAPSSRAPHPDTRQGAPGIRADSPSDPWGRSGQSG